METLAVLIETVSFFDGVRMVEVKEGTQVTVDLSLSVAKSEYGAWFDIAPAEYQLYLN